MRSSALLLCLVLSPCAAQQRLPLLALPGERFFIGSDIEVRAPKSSGWRLVERSSRVMSFARQAGAPGETLGAQVFVFDLQPTETPEQFVSLIKANMDQGWKPQRFDTIRAASDYTAERGYPCVRFQVSLLDKLARTSPSTTEPLPFEVHALYCRHPARTGTGFSAVYSHRGRSAHASFAEEARDYIDGVRVP